MEGTHTLNVDAALECQISSFGKSESVVGSDVNFVRLADIKVVKAAEGARKRLWFDGHIALEAKTAVLAIKSQEQNKTTVMESEAYTLRLRGWALSAVHSRSA